MSVHLRPPAQSALRVIVVCQRLHLRHRNLQNLRPLPNRLRRQLHRQNLLRRQLPPQNQGPRQDRCHPLHQSQLLVAAEGPRSQSRRLLLLRADAPDLLRLFLPRQCFQHTTRAVRFSQTKPPALHVRNKPITLPVHVSSFSGGASESVFDHNHLPSQKVGGTDFKAYEESK